jgi:hypothetical protein
MKIRHEKFMHLFYKDTSIYQELFGDNNSFSSFEYRIKKVSKKKAIYYGYEEGEAGENKMKGDLFEIFTEAFIHLCGSHSSVCISSYRPVEIGNDNGVDGTGLCMKSNTLTVQVKFRSEIDYELVGGDLKQFWGQSIVRYGVDSQVVGNMVIFTNCSGVNWYTLKDVLMGKIRAINRVDIIAILKNNNCFWDNLRLIVEDTLKENLGDDYEYEWNPNT